MDMDSAYGNDKNPLIEKSEFILSLFEQLVGAGNLSAKEKSILDRCTADVYRDYIRSGYQGQVPTLKGSLPTVDAPAGGRSQRAGIVLRIIY